jgi:periplasmic copper chaperone A
MQRLVASLLFALLAVGPASAQAPAAPAAVATGEVYMAGGLRISQVWTPVPPGGAQAAGGYMTITNTGTEPDTLTGGTVAVAARVEVHEMSIDGGVMRMRELNPGLVIKPGETVVLRPGSFHLMLMDIKETPVLGKPFKGTLVFEKAGKVEVEFKVEPFGTRTPGGVAKGSDEATGHGGHGKPAPGHGSGQHQKH